MPMPTENPYEGLTFGFGIPDTIYRLWRQHGDENPVYIEAEDEFGKRWDKYNGEPYAANMILSTFTYNFCEGESSLCIFAKPKEKIFKHYWE